MKVLVEEDRQTKKDLKTSFRKKEREMTDQKVRNRFWDRCLTIITWLLVAGTVITFILEIIYRSQTTAYLNLGFLISATFVLSFRLGILDGAFRTFQDEVRGEFRNLREELKEVREELRNLREELLRRFPPKS